MLLEAGAGANILTEDGERPYDLIEPHDLDTVGVMLSFRTMREGVEEEDEEESDEEGSDVSDDVINRINNQSIIFNLSYTPIGMILNKGVLILNKFGVIDFQYIDR